MKKLREKYVESAARGMPNCKLTNYETVLSTTDFDKVVFMGVLRGTHLVYKHAQKNKKDFYYIDRPYWGESRATPYWMRCVKNQHVKTFVDHRPDDRFKKQYKDEIKPFHKNGSYVLVVPPSHAMAEMFNGKDWLDNTMKILKENTDREIDIREKPYNPIVGKDHVGATVKIETRTVHKGEINWNDYHAMVTYNSNTMVASLTNGVPVFCDPVNSAAAPISETDFTKIETPVYGDRIALFSSLAYNNWTLDEMADGTAWRMLNES